MSRFPSELGPQAGTRGLLWPSRTRAATLPPLPPSNLAPAGGPTRPRTAPGRRLWAPRPPLSQVDQCVAPSEPTRHPCAGPRALWGLFSFPGWTNSVPAQMKALREAESTGQTRAAVCVTGHISTRLSDCKHNAFPPVPRPTVGQRALPSPLQTDALLSRGCPVPQAPLLDCRARVEAVPQPQQGLTCEELSLTGPRSPWGPAAPGSWAFGSTWLIRGALFCRPRVCVCVFFF